MIKLIINKALESNVTLIMATNDRFVMNNVDIKYWSIMQRIGNISKVHNYRNSPDIFKDFEFTGLTNFDFFSTEFYLKGFEDK